MALTENQIREYLSEAGCPAENIESATKKIHAGHITSINALREQRDSYKEAAEQLPGVQKELNELKSKSDPDLLKKLEDKTNELEDFKKEVAAEKLKAQKTDLYTALLKGCNVGENRIPAILKVTDMDSLTIKEDGTLDNVDGLKTAIENDWGAFILKKKEEGAPVETPPGNNGGEKKEEPSRAKEIADKFRENIYGKAKEN